RVDVISPVLPRAPDAVMLRLAAEPAFGPALARHAGHPAGAALFPYAPLFRSVLQLEDLALHVDGDLLGQVARGNRGGHFGDVADLAGQVRGHQVHVVGQILPGARDTAHPCLAAELALGADLARHASDFGGEVGQLLDHGVHHLADAKELALEVPSFDFDRHRLGQVAFSDRANHARDLYGRLDHIVDEIVDRAQLGIPAAGRALDLGTVPDLPFLS